MILLLRQPSANEWIGPTQTGDAPYLAQTNIAPFVGVSYIPNAPLETQVPIANAEGRNIFQSLANISPYFPNPRGFGVDEYAVPPGSNVTWLYIAMAAATLSSAVMRLK
jgi:hypothetical protein